MDSPWTARGQPEDEARILREALFTVTGPATFPEIGVPKSAYRRHLLKPYVFRIAGVPDPLRNLNDLPLPARGFLVNRGLQNHMPLQGRQDWAEFVRLCEKIARLETQYATREKLFLFCLAGGKKYIGSADRLERLMRRASELVRVTRNISHYFAFTIDTAICAIIEAQIENDGGLP